MGYPTPPGERIPYDIDGTRGFIFQNAGLRRGQMIEMAQAALRALNADKGLTLHVEGDNQQVEPSNTDPLAYWAMIPNGSGFGQSFLPGPLMTSPVFVALVFPQPMRIRGMFAAHALLRGYSAASSAQFYVRFPMSLELSSDTTNGQDGTWTIAVAKVYGPNFGQVQGSPPGVNPSVNPDGSLFETGTHRMHIGTGSVFRNLAAIDGRNGGIHAVDGGFTRQVRGARLVFRDNPEANAESGLTGTLDMFNVGRYLADAWMNFHLYGEPDTEATDDQLAFVTPAGAPMDFGMGDVYAGQVIVQQFKVRNLSDMNAINVDLSFVGPNPTPTPSPHVSMEFSLNGTVYSSSLMFNEIPAGTDSATIYARATIPSGLVGPWGPRILTEVGEWS